MLPVTVGITAAFPVPTPANPNAVFIKQKLLEGGVEETFPTKAEDDERRKIRNELAIARNDNKAKVAEDFRRREDLEACKRKWKAEEATAAKEERRKEMESLGLPESCAYLLETAQYAMKQYKDAEPKSITESGDVDAKVYERAVKRILTTDGQPGIDRLKKDLDARADRNAKRVRTAKEVTDGVNADNAEFNKSLNRTMGKDARAQMLKQNLERGTAL